MTTNIVKANKKHINNQVFIIGVGSYIEHIIEIGDYAHIEI